MWTVADDHETAKTWDTRLDASRSMLAHNFKIYRICGQLLQEAAAEPDSTSYRQATNTTLLLANHNKLDVGLYSTI